MEKSDIIHVHSSDEAYTELENSVHSALETYSNVHRGSGHKSLVTTDLFEHARSIVLRHLGLSRTRYCVIFCNHRRAEMLTSTLKPNSFKSINSNELGLSLGVYALAIQKSALPNGIPYQTGGGTTRVVSSDWVLWAKAPDKFEAGTPAIINIIAFCKALLLISEFGKDAFAKHHPEEELGGSIAQTEHPYDLEGHELLLKVRESVIGGNIEVPTMNGMRRFVNLDSASSTPTLAPIWDMVCKTWRMDSRSYTKMIQEVKEICYDYLNASPSSYQVIFTSNTTEAINLVAESFDKNQKEQDNHFILSTMLEHNSNDLPWRSIPNHNLLRLSADYDGIVDLNELDHLLSTHNGGDRNGTQGIKLVAINGASNVLGIYNDIDGISKIVHKHGAKLLVDAAQMIAHRNVNVDEWDVDYLTFSAHKAYAPFGTGVLLAKEGNLNFTDDEMNLIRLSGEENVVGIAALGKALTLLKRIGLDVIKEEESRLTTKLLNEMSEIPNLTLYGIKNTSSPRFIQKGGVVVFLMKGLMAHQIAKGLADREGIGIRSGCHCAHVLVKHMLDVKPGLEQFQRVLLTVFPKVQLPGVARISLGIENTDQDIDRLISTLGEMARKTKTEIPSGEYKKKLNHYKESMIHLVFNES